MAGWPFQVKKPEIRPAALNHDTEEDQRKPVTVIAERWGSPSNSEVNTTISGALKARLLLSRKYNW